MPVKFDSESFGENLKQAVYERAREAMAEHGAEMQAIFDSVFDSFQGRPVDEVAAEIRRRVSGRWDLTKEHVARYAEGISEGRRVKVEVDTSNLH